MADRHTQNLESASDDDFASASDGEQPSPQDKRQDSWDRQGHSAAAAAPPLHQQHHQQEEKATPAASAASTPAWPQSQSHSQPQPGQQPGQRARQSNAHAKRAASTQSALHATIDSPPDVQPVAPFKTQPSPSLRGAANRDQPPSSVTAARNTHQSRAQHTSAAPTMQQSNSTPPRFAQNKAPVGKPDRTNPMQQFNNTFRGDGTPEQEAMSRTGATQDQGGWGSFSSWINTAVSTVSVVMENPNVVVSKAQTIGQGIRSVATEQIDRVYESLDPEYEYERERQKQRVQQNPHSPAPGQRQQEQTTYALAQPASIQNQHFDNNWNSLSSQFPQPEAPTVNNGVELKQCHQINENEHLTGFASSKLAYQDESADADAGGDGWGDDAWGDDWGGQLDGDNLDTGISGSLPEINEFGLASKDAAPTLQLPSPPEDPAQTHQQVVKGPYPIRKSLDRHDRTSSPMKIARDLPSEEIDSQKFLPTNKTGSGLNIPSAFGEQGRPGFPDQQSQRRPSSDLRPAEALFSTLDFASNALGSAVLGVHRKVTQASPTPSSRSAPAPNAQFIRPSSPATAEPIQNKSSSGGRDISGTMDRLAMANPSLEVVGGNVVSTGLGALESLGKRAVDVISDVRRAGHLSQGQGSSQNSDIFDENNAFRVPPRMSFTVLVDEAGGRLHIVATRALASAAAARVAPLAAGRRELLEMGQLDDLEQLLQPESLDSAIGELSIDLLAGHKDFRAMVALLEKMGVHGTTHLRQLRNCTRKLGSLVSDTVHAFEQEWHNHQSRASEKDFFARAPIKKFFESKLLSIYFDGLRALAQFTTRTCDQALRIAETLNVRVAEKTGTVVASSTAHLEGDEREHHPPLVLATVLQQFMGSLIAETKFVAKTYFQTMDAIIVAAKQFTTPLDNLDWEDLSMGVDKIKALLIGAESVEAVGLIHSATLCILDILKNELMLDALQGRIVPTVRKPQVKVQPKPRALPAAATVDALPPRPLSAASSGRDPISSRPRNNPPPKPKVVKDEDFFSILDFK
ncbi:hypothetical protein KVV02_002039 [Mortierella alpina]|uniref:Uncharacterized protein n=1 Tax=Mortierella alpina TaxID=64518 RepID=A0A9P8A997_MORAP|nr:hypothetical protein KVV02_002039 [Mortierella alpina]